MIIRHTNSTYLRLERHAKGDQKSRLKNKISGSKPGREKSKDCWQN